ncbi:MAG: hypothetical protein OEY41_09505 [Acidimicrobiia bacterium]|nr:hypothetical protein [Acidimicrobiia bacterium]MDH5290224.1 hypothetical protein [Acidimicrobiia bacterium]
MSAWAEPGGPSPDRDAFVASGMEGGVREGYERLDELLAAAES